MSSFQIGPVTFHVYGLIVGAAIVVGYWLVTIKAKKMAVSAKELEYFLWSALVGGLMGARLWHVMTDWQYYQAHWSSVWHIWNGGLSIIGAIVGALTAVALMRKWCKVTVSWQLLLDLSVFGLPVGQALGRWANFVNQELYGYPTRLPWGIAIAPEYRLAQFQSSARFHPLFAYEMIATLLAAAVLWWWASDRGAVSRPSWLKMGSGRWFLLYIGYYSVIRCGLDFLRPDKTILGWGLGFNQVMLLVIAVVVLGGLVYSVKKDTKR